MNRTIVVQRDSRDLTARVINALDAEDGLLAARDEAVDAAKRAEGAAPFPDRAAAEAAHVPADVTIINVDGLQYRRDPGATDLVTADGATWAQIDRKNTLDATRAPLPSDDETQGYAPGSRWLWQGQEWMATSTASGGAVWLRNGDPRPQMFGAVGNDVADDTAAMGELIAQAIIPRRAEISPGTYRLHRADPVGGGGTNPQDWALNPDQPEWITGNGIDTVLRSQAPNNNVIARVGLLPIGDREPDIIGGGIDGVIFDGNFNASDPAARTGWVDSGNMALWASGVQDWTLRNTKILNSPDYGLGLQNGRHKRLRLRDVVIDNTMNDALDLKNNYGRGRDNSMIGVWAERFGQGTDEQFPFAGIDLMAPRWVMSHVWATNWGQAGNCQSAIRLKHGEPGESRGIGAYKAVLMGFHVDALSGGHAATMGVDVRHRRAVVALGTIEGVINSGVNFEQERGIALGLDIQGAGATTGAGIRTRINGQTTNGDHAISSAIRVSNFQAGLILGSNGGIHTGLHLRGNSKAVIATGNDNAVLAWSEDNGGSAPVNDTGLRNWIGLWEAGTLNVYRAGKRRYSFGDVIENIADLDTLVARMSVTGGGGWVETTAPTINTGAWVTNTNGAYSWRRNGTEVLRADANQVTAGVPLRLKGYSVAALGGLTVGSGATVYCTDGDAGQPCIAVWNGGSWLRVPLGATVSTT